MFQSGFHRLAFFYAVASVIVWFFAFQSWWGTIAACRLHSSTMVCLRTVVS
jgi:hypothetical protein